ncbi:hypothetical protein K5V21_16080 [Clostridium sardiniense]|uniref:J domain-containing protein n=1 Tax=Clostridium sardiniense TaxID=29369 RepID=A0ABS7L1R0_CLOSR|nr:hypothetical protein [Clostridium sardiniense]MBY0756940.1 hypothetical protein [Clostridium sardiniense]MBY0756964.1 hypothetical protein [Clostridium sardiniense]MDQ0460358.1 hypothetical protein [Clostridium sardiniense]
MYCVIQEIDLKKENTNGAHKELESYCSNWSIDGKEYRRYYYRHTGDRFKRPIKKAYRISIHKSYRRKGKVKKKQKVICTINYYDIIDITSYVGDYCYKIEDKAKELGLTEDKLMDIIYEKFDHIIERIESEFKTTEEYRVRSKHKEIINKYLENKRAFEEVYGENTYDYCYDVFGELREKKKLNDIKRQYEANKEYERSYYENFKNNYSNNSYSSYFNTKQNNYNEEDKKKYKKMYKTLSAKFHPDVYNDDGEMMKFINGLKEDWGL